MTLAPCPTCRRHVRVDQLRAPCPFCRTDVERAGDVGIRPSLVRRMSRAAIFAGATLSGCSSASQPSHVTPPPPDDHQALAMLPPPVDAAPLPPPDAPPPRPVDAGTPIAATPPDAAVAVQTPAPVGTAIVRGTVKTSKGAPATDTEVSLEGGPQELVTSTDAKGRYELRAVIAGEYTLMVQPPIPANLNPRFTAPQLYTRRVKVIDKKVQRFDVVLAPYKPVDRGPCCMPYGAPPGRRRVV